MWADNFSAEYMHEATDLLVTRVSKSIIINQNLYIEYLFKYARLRSFGQLNVGVFVYARNVSAFFFL